MEKIKKILNIEENNFNRVSFTLLLLIAFVFSMSVRYTWVNEFSAIDNFKWNNELMINTNDGYFWAEGARDILSGNHQDNDLSPVLQPLPILTAWLSKILPISFETLILWMPGVLGSFLVIPIMLIARLFKQDGLGFSAALLGSIAWSYYNRTMIGYYDTDMLIVVLPTLMVWGLMYALKYEKISYFIIAPIFAMFSVYWHAGTMSIIYGTFFITLLYTLIYERKNKYYYKFLTILVLAITTLPIWLKLLLLIGLTLLYHVLKEKVTEKILIVIAIISSTIYLIFGGFEWIMSILHNAYISRLLLANELDIASLKFFSVLNTVREAGKIPFEVFANRISGDTITFFLSLIGYILLLVRYRLMLLSLPMVALGFFALQGGLRFTVFAVPFMALGLMFLIFLFAQYFESFFEKKAKIFAKYTIVILATIAVLYPNVKHAMTYKVPTVFITNEVAVLEKLKNLATREDYVVSWWDYGYPIRYYSDIKTLVDGGRHNGKSNFPVAFTLLNNQVAAANMARLSVEFTEKSFTKNCGLAIECILKAYNVNNPNIFLKSLNSKEFKLPKKTRDIYFYLPHRMLSILSTIDLFTNLDLLSGKAGSRPFFYMTKNFKDNGDSVNLAHNIILHKKTASISIGGKSVPLNFYMHVYYDQKGIHSLNVQQLHKKNSGISVIFMESYGEYLIVDDKILNSLYFRLFVLESYDKDLYELVISSPYTKVYKLKI